MERLLFRGRLVHTAAMTQQRQKKSEKAPRKIAVVTGGGDCPGLNAVIRAVVVSALNRGWEVYGIERGFEGLLHKDRIMRLESHHVRGIIHTGGTILGTTNRGNPFKLEREKKGKHKTTDVSAAVVARFKKLGFDAMIVIGGDVKDCLTFGGFGHACRWRTQND